MSLAAALIVTGCGSAASSPNAADASPADSSADSPSTDTSSPALDAAPRVPAQHRVASESCPTTPPPDDCPAGAGGCGGCTAGKNGHCVLDTHVCVCRYDDCFSASDCATGKICSCRATSPGAFGSNVCIASGCDVDADCGLNGYCSPTFDTVCGPSHGIVGWFCHAAKDTCVDDVDCTVGGKVGYCAYHAKSAVWSCAYAVCS